jgi:hypothetical protein
LLHLLELFVAELGGLRVTPQRDSVFQHVCYITDVKTGIPYWILVLLAVGAFLMTSLAGQPQAPAHEGAGTASLDQTSTRTSPGAKGRKIPCKTPENASLCYWTHGRLRVYNGNPSDRIWNVATHRLLGVFNGPSHYPPHTFADDENPELPVNLERAYEADYRHWKKSKADTGYEFPTIFADFEVCALESEKKGEMQPVCVESAKNIVVQKSY